jgi:hypothetical protein
VTSAFLRLSVHASTDLVASASLKLQPVMVAHLDTTEVAVVFVWPALTVVANELVVRQNEAFAGEQSAGFAGVLISPPGKTL